MTIDLLIGLVTLAILYALEAVLPFYRDRRDRLAHGLRNGGLALTAGAVGALQAPLTLAVMALTAGAGFGLTHWLTPVLTTQLVPSVLAALLTGALVFVLFDLWMYLWHRMNHRLSLLWRFHQVHHTDTAMDATTALRFHPGEIILSNLLRLPVIALLGMGMVHLLVYQSVMLVVILFHHSNLRVPDWLDHGLRPLLVPPSLHRVHHSHLRVETDSNYGTVFSVWDRLFGSLVIRPDPEAIEFGTGRRDGPQWQGVGRLLSLPLRPLRDGDAIATASAARGDPTAAGGA
ncbi:MAG: fatty acid hydroxylase family protein [Chromatiaceae bacterium]|nr:MAG: fatty acid hydroxylase family protein [Chromatiaceae bacterium]